MFHHEATMAWPREHRRGPLKTRPRALRPATTPSAARRHPGLLLLLFVTLSWASLLGSASAASLLPHAGRNHRTRSAPLPQILQADPLVPAWDGPSLVVDTREPPMPPAYHGDATETTSAPPAKRSIKTDPDANGDFEIPVPFDSALNNNFTTNCAQFFRTMLTSETVTGCHPFSLMLQVHPIHYMGPNHD